MIDHFDAAVRAAGSTSSTTSSRPVGEVLREHGGSFFEDSLEIDARGIFWNDEMAAQFESRRGYGARRFLPSSSSRA